jgi:hypothetical protein
VNPQQETGARRLQKPPIFILSCYRSGSTLLRYILDSHPDVYCPPELSLGQSAVDLRAGRAGVVPGGTDAPCRLQASAADLLGIARGGLNPRKAFEDGRLGIEGDFDFRALPALVQLLYLPQGAGNR